MAMRYVSFGIYLMFICEKFGAVYGVNNFTEFMKNDDLQNHTCSDVQTIFDDTGNGSLAHCVFKCSKTSGCYGVFHHAEKGRCVGCRDKFLKKDSAPLSVGTDFYSISMYGIVESYILVIAVTTWNDAKDHCEDLGGHLADIKSLEEEQFIETYVIPGLGNGALIWIGATDDQIEGTFLWQDGTRVEDAFVNWAPGEPNSYGQHGHAEHCGLFRRQQDMWVWNDGMCHSLYSSLCEFD